MSLNLLLCFTVTYGISKTAHKSYFPNWSDLCCINLKHLLWKIYCPILKKPKQTKTPNKQTKLHLKNIIFIDTKTLCKVFLVPVSPNSFLLNDLGLEREGKDRYIYKMFSLQACKKWMPLRSETSESTVELA